ncbi:MAG: ParB/RepB/Spo0J family partition protein [Verrucomicrobia bacterium]|nr:ParB/RepB/Spo0J family partition protein [Verrucomicrobiota bacterium]
MAKSSSPRQSRLAAERPRTGSVRLTPGLGRGLSEIIAQGVPSPAATDPLVAGQGAAAGHGVREIPLSEIQPNPNQPRLRFVDEPLDELVASIREHGVLQPITVRPRDNPRLPGGGQGFEIIAGERRYRACQKAGLASIRAMVKNVSDEQALELALVENLQREDLGPVEEASGYRKLADAFALTQEQIAQKVGKNRATIANAMRLLELPDEVQGYLGQGRLSTGHAKAILGLADQEHRIHVARDVIKRGLNVRQTELLVSRLRSPSETGPTCSSRSKVGAEISPLLRALQEALQQKLATRVRIQPAGNGGRIEINYYTPADLDRLLELFQIRM